MPKFITSQDGAEKQDCERNAAKRWLATHGPRLRELRPVYLGDALFACQPICEAVLESGSDFLFTAKPASHITHLRFHEGRHSRGKVGDPESRWAEEHPSLSLVRRRSAARWQVGADR